jgi:hypothetical protein
MDIVHTYLPILAGKVKHRKKMKIAACLLSLALLPACATKTAKTGTLEERARQQYASRNTIEPAPPAEGPGDVPAEGPFDLRRNPALVPSPLLRMSAASGL